MTVGAHVTEALPASPSDGKKLLAVGLLTLATLVVFNRFPTIDIAVSRIFFDPSRCDWAGPGVPCTYFPAYESKALETLRFGLQYFQLATAVCLCLYLVGRYANGARLRSPGMVSQMAAVVSYVLSVGLMINLALKPLWGRPRPSETDLFNGDFPMVPAGVIAPYCQSNCSFVSGEAGGAFWLLCFATLLPERWRTTGLVATLAVATLTAYLRVAFGMHFLSDVVLAALLVVMTFIATRLVITRFARSGGATAGTDPGRWGRRR